MPSQHRYPAITSRGPEDVRERAQAAAAAVGSNLSAHILAFVRWLAHDTDELPERPEQPPPGT
jgi:hypothetical protein